MNRAALAIALLAVAAGVPACTSSASGGGNQHGALLNGGTFTGYLDSDPGNLNPLRAVQTTTNNVISFAYDTLLNYGKDGKLVPQLATHWDVTPTKVTYTLRKGVTCSDGTKLTASTVADNFNWIKDPKNGSSFLGSALPDADYTVSADDAAGTVTISRTKPYGFLLDGTGTMPIVCAKGLKDPKILAQGTDGTGPFVLTSYKSEDTITMKVRKDYRWGPNGIGSNTPGFPAQVVFRIVTDPSTAVNLFLQGQLNAVDVTPQDEPRVQGRGFGKLLVPNGPYDLFFNEREDAFADPAVRKALVTGLNLDGLTKVLTDGQGERAKSLTVVPPLPCDTNGAQGVVPDFDLAAAGAMLDQAGWVKGSDGIREKNGTRLSINLAYTTGLTELDAASELVSQEWKKLGVDVHLVGQGNNAYLQTLFGGSKWDATILRVNISYPTEFVAFGSGPVPPKGQNFAAIDNSQYTDLIGQAIKTPGQPGCDLWEQAERALFSNFDVTAIADQDFVTYIRGATFHTGIRAEAEPTCIRLYKQ